MATYHVSPDGSDSADGRVPATAWRTLDRANQAVLSPGDSLLLAGGREFVGSLSPTIAAPAGLGAPVVLGSYGAGRARIRSSGFGIWFSGAGGITVRDLVLVGEPPAALTAPGIGLFNDKTALGRLPSVTITDVDVSGFQCGISLGGGNGVGFRAPRIIDAVLHDNREAGLATYGPAFDAVNPAYAHAQIEVAGVTAYRNLGDPNNLARNTGNGIVLGSVDGAAVSRCTAYENGSLCAAPEGPVGIWTYDSTGVTIHDCLSYCNRTGGVADGGGFDLDQNVSSSVLEYNLSYGNAGPGYLLYSGRDNSAHTRNVVRYNVAAEDARLAGGRYGGVTVLGAVSDALIRRNTVVVTGFGAAPTPALLLGTGLSRVRIQDTVVRATASGPAVVAPDLSRREVLMQGNHYIIAETATAVRWGRIGYSTVAAWRAATGQEPGGS